MLKLLKLLPWFGALSGVIAMPATANTVYLVRHAEKQQDSKDPALTACGQARADALARYFNIIPLQAVYTTPYQRTRQTAAAVASSKQLPVTEYDPAKPSELQQQLLAHTQPVLVVGHSNTVPELVKLLSGIEVAPLSEQQYNLLYEVKPGEQGSITLRQQPFGCGQTMNSKA